jgi:hypothetical protein
MRIKSQLLLLSLRTSLANTVFNNYVMKHFKYAAAIIILLFSALSVSAGNHIPVSYITNEASALHKKESDGRMFLITVIDSNDKDIGTRCETEPG